MDDWLVWQLVDSAYPAGGLAHSAGLEAARQAGFAMDADSLAAFVEASLRQAESAAVPFLLAVHRSPEALVDCDSAWDLQLNNHVANRASRAQGQAFVSSASRIFGGDDLVVLARRVRSRELAGHLATMLGFVTQSFDIPAATARRIFLFLTTRGIVSSAARLGIIGPLEGQSLQARIAVPDARCEPPEPMPTAVQTMPVFDLVQATQDRLYSRLFQS